MTVPAARIHAAWQEAQEAFRLMLDAKVYGDPAAPETRAYVTAERHLEMLLEDAQFAEAQAQMDRLIETRYDPTLALGDHHIGVGR
jgi:hypothetical protein